MKVKELIEALEEVDPNMDVVTISGYGDGSYDLIEEVKVRSFYKKLGIYFRYADGIPALTLNPKGIY
jgi:hypothetical protein